jgi:hypothetical protein
MTFGTGRLIPEPSLTEGFGSGTGAATGAGSTRCVFFAGGTAAAVGFGMAFTAGATGCVAGAAGVAGGTPGGFATGGLATGTAFSGVSRVVVPAFTGR